MLKKTLCVSKKQNGKSLASNSLEASNNMAPGSMEPILNTCSTAAEKLTKHGVVLIK